ncbi:prepilin peptidase [Moritella sp. JT01]|uniref:prepilin peptidase n=1 Tax=Moritella sp. JT01 TaxID=756698 RepID=UPI0008304E58|nr:A24 family peptidase [Moritella sp. JT01]
MSLYALLFALFFCTTYMDVTVRQLPNSLVILTALLCLTVAISGDFYISSLQQSALALALGFGLFLLRVCGAGDIKLIAAYLLGIKPEYWALFLFVMSLIGTFVGVVQYIFRGQQNAGIPYGIAISLSGLSFVIASV